MADINSCTPGIRISDKGNKVVTNRDCSQDTYKNGQLINHQNAPKAKVAQDTYRPQPSSRPVPPSVNRPTPPAVNPSPADYGRPTPPAVHVPRYYWQPKFPVYVPTERREIPYIALPPAPSPARQVSMNEVTKDPVVLLADKQRLREDKKRFLGMTYPEITAATAKSRLAAGQKVFLAPDGGAHLNKSVYKPVTTKDLEPLLPGLRSEKLGEMQASENRSYQTRVNQWVDEDVSRRMDALPPFNSVFDTSRLAVMNMMVREDGRSFNRNMVTAMNVYNQSSVQREIAEKWHNNPDMGTSEFNRMAASVVSKAVSNLYWQSSYMGDMGSYLGTNPVPGLRYPDTQDDVDYNVAAIQRVASELPALLNSSINY